MQDTFDIAKRCMGNLVRVFKLFKRAGAIAIIESDEIRVSMRWVSA